MKRILRSHLLHSFCVFVALRIVVDAQTSLAFNPNEWRNTQALEVPELRDFIRRRHCDGAYPQMIMRLGFADSEISGVRRSPADVSRPEP